MTPRWMWQLGMFGGLVSYLVALHHYAGRGDMGGGPALAGMGVSGFVLALSFMRLTKR